MPRIPYTHLESNGCTVYGWFESNGSKRYRGIEPESVDCTCGDRYSSGCAYNPKMSYLPEELYRTDLGFWILNRIEISDGGAEMSTYTSLPDEVAREWLVRNEYGPIADHWLPNVIKINAEADVIL
jgi:hypothetical protein